MINDKLLYVLHKQYLINNKYYKEAMLKLKYSWYYFWQNKSNQNVKYNEEELHIISENKDHIACIFSLHMGDTWLCGATGTIIVNNWHKHISQNLNLTDLYNNQN